MAISSDEGGHLDMAVPSMGGPENKVLADTSYRRAEAARVLSLQVDGLIGRDFFGSTTVKLTWRAGQIVSIESDVRQVLQ